MKASLSLLIILVSASTAELVTSSTPTYTRTSTQIITNLDESTASSGYFSTTITEPSSLDSTSFDSTSSDASTSPDAKTSFGTTTFSKPISTSDLATSLNPTTSSVPSTASDSATSSSTNTTTTTTTTSTPAKTSTEAIIKDWADYIYIIVLPVVGSGCLLIILLLVIWAVIKKRRNRRRLEETSGIDDVSVETWKDGTSPYVKRVQDQEPSRRFSFANPLYNEPAEPADQ